MMILKKNCPFNPPYRLIPFLLSKIFNYFFSAAYFCYHHILWKNHIYAFPSVCKTQGGFFSPPFLPLRLYKMNYWWFLTNKKWVLCLSLQRKSKKMQNMSTKASLQDLCRLTLHLNFFYTPPGAWHGKNYGMAWQKNFPRHAKKYGTHHRIPPFPIKFYKISKK